MFFLISILYGFYKERKRADKAIKEFNKFTAEMQERIAREDGEEEDGGGKKEEQQKSVKEEKKKLGWKRRIVGCCGTCRRRMGKCCERVKRGIRWLCDVVRSGRWKPANKRLLELIILLAMFIMMQAIGSLFYVVIALKFSTYSQSTGTFVGLGVQSVLFLILLSRHLRVIFFVTLPSLVGSRIRAILVIMMLTWAFQFPAQNVTSNVQSAMEGVNCVSQRVKEAVDEVKERAGHNFRDVPLQQLNQFLKDQAKPFEGIRQTMRKLDDKLEKMLDWQRGLIKKIHNLMQNCTHMAQLPLKACVGWLGERHADCLERYFETICKPIDLVKGLCYLTKVIELNCDWPARVKGSIKEGVTHFVKGAKRKATDYAKQTFMYQLVNKTLNESVSAFNTLEINIEHEHKYKEEFQLDKERIQEELRKEIRHFENFLQFITFLLDLLMAFLVIWPFLMAVLYVKSFKKSDSADNHYIDAIFESIDRARALNGQPTLLPLLPREKKQYIRTCSLRTTTKEKLLGYVQHALLFFSVLPIGIFILIDIFVYKLLRKSFIFFHGNSTIFPVPSIYKLKVAGNGILNQLLANILDTFEPLTDATKRDQMWRQCFTEPTPPNYELFQIILLLYIICAFLIRLQTYLKRCRHIIALHFFPDRARPRALFLYNKILRKRMQLWDMMSDIEKSKKDGEGGERQLLLKGLAVLSEDKQQCLRCARTDLSLQELSNIRLCVRCHSVYCVDCYNARQRCLAEECRAPLQTIVEDVELYVDSSAEEDDEEQEEDGQNKEEEEDGQPHVEGQGRIDHWLPIEGMGKAPQPGWLPPEHMIQ